MSVSAEAATVGVTGVGARGLARARDVFARAEADPTGRLRAAIVFVASALTSLVLWYPLGLPSELVRNLIAQPTVICSFGGGPNDFLGAMAAAGTPRMYFCSFGVAILTMAGPLVLLVVAFIYRQALARLVKKAAAHLPSQAGFMVGPLLASLLFAAAWSGSHYTTAWNMGLLPQTLFPGVVGLFTFAVGRWGGAVQMRLARFFETRDRYPMKLRIGAAVLMPMVFGFVLTAENRVSFPAVKEQIVVIFGLLCGFLALAPRTGDVMAGAGAQLATVAQQVRDETSQRIAQARAGRQ